MFSSSRFVKIFNRKPSAFWCRDCINLSSKYSKIYGRTNCQNSNCSTQIFFLYWCTFFEHHSQGIKKMAQHPSAEKQARKALKHRARNRRYISIMKTAIKRVVQSKEKDKATVELRRAVKLLDQLAAKGIIHRNNAANKKSRLTKLVTSLKWAGFH